MTVHPNNLGYSFDDLYDEDLEIIAHMFFSLRNLGINTRQAESLSYKEALSRITIKIGER